MILAERVLCYKSPEHFSSAIGDTATEASTGMAVKIGVDTVARLVTSCSWMADTLVIHKVLSTPDNPARAVLQGCASAAR